MTFIEAINALGSSPESIATKLREMGIKGYKCSAGNCPVAKYLNACGFPEVTVSYRVSRYPNHATHTPEETVYLQEGVQEWIRRFDDGQFPEFSLS